MPGLATYNVPTLVKVGRTLNAELVRKACETIVERHEILRTTVALIDGVPTQEVSPLRRFDLFVADLRPALDSEAEASELVAELASRPFDLATEVLLRAALLHVKADEDLLLIVLNHAASDHASRKLLLGELDALYTALEAGAEPALPDLPIQYADFAEWQRERLDGKPLEELLAYWTGHMAGAPDRLELPTDRPRPAAQSYRGSHREFTIGPALGTRLRELARSQRATQFMVLLAGFKTLLYRYTGVTDLVVGTPISGRHHEETANLLGYFSNTLALRSDLSGDPTFTELVARVKATTIAAQTHQELPFEKLVESLNPRRTESHSPVFQVLFGFDGMSAPAPTLAGHELETLPVPGWQWARFDLSMVLRELPDGGLAARIEYPTDLFDATTIDRLVGHFERLLHAAASDPDQRLSMLPILTADEERQLLVDWNQTTRPYDRRCLHELFADQAARTPDAVAVVDSEQRITFSQLDRRSSQLARELGRLGAGAGTLVGICLDRSVDLVISLLGVLKSGAAYVPIEPTYPPQRQEFILADAAAPVLITQDRLLGVIDPRGAAVISVERDRESIEAHSGDPLPHTSDPEQLAYVIYTSGSTGQPKGVEVTHGSVANLIAHTREQPGIDQRDVVANLITPAFDVSGLDWYLPLSTGARLVIVPREATLDSVDLADWLARSKATFVQATPTTWQLLVDGGWEGSDGLKIVCGGEALPRLLADELLRRGASLWHMYGPTETTVWSSVLQLGADAGPTAIGGPIANTSFYVLDANRRPVPIGVPGELYIGGDGLALGYRNRRELTAEKFVDDPFATDGRGRLYRTGDLMRWREAGTLEFHGRIDHQVKLRGFRIELGEIEAVLDGHPAVAASVAAVREDAPGDRRLVAYVVSATGEPPDFEDLRRLLKTKLPPFMIPSTFVALESFPLSANGKLDRQALPAPDGARPDLGRAYAAPETPVQEKLAAIWAEVLGLERVGIDDDFFEIGGHSLLAVKMLTRVLDTLGVEHGLARVFEHSTIRALAEVLARENADGEAGTGKRFANLTPAQRAVLEKRLVARHTESARRNVISRREVYSPAELSYAQELLWLLGQVSSDAGVAYNAPGAFQLQGPLDLGLLARAFEALVDRQEILRTTYTVIDGRPMQIIGPTAPVELNVVDLRGRTADEQQAESQRVLKEEARFAFDLVNGPAMRPTVIRLSDSEHILMVNMHHIATDGYSRGALYRDLTVFYDALQSNTSAELPELKIQYADYAVWQRAWLDGGVAGKQLEYWKRKLARAPASLDLPTDFSRPPVRSWTGSSTRLMIDMATREGLRGVARTNDATLFVGLLTLFGVLLSRYSGQDDIVIGTPFGGRSRSELDGMVGYFINPLALRIDLSGDPSFSELIGRSRETTLEAFANADLPYETVVRTINPERDLSTTPVFQAMIVLHNPAWQTQRPKFEPQGIRCTEITHEKGWSKFDLLLGMSERQTGLNTTWEYSTELFTSETMTRMTEHFRTLAESAANNPDRPLSRLSMLSEQERSKVLAWNAHPEPLPEARSIKELFEDQVRRTPEAPAVVFGPGRLTFDECNRRANRIAWRLREHGVGPGTHVAIMMEKSLDLVPAVLGVVKAGGAFIPIDPNYPPDRVEFMLGDASPKVLLTHQKQLEALPPSAAEVVVLDSPGLLDTMSDENPADTASGDDLAYIIYTSGSTGQPKGAMIAHRNLVSVYFAYEREYRLRELRAHIQVASFSFDVFTGDMIRSLLAGAKLVLCPIEVVVDPPALYELMVAEGVDAAEFVPTAATLLFEWAEREGKPLGFMRFIAVGGEPWRNDKYAYFRRLLGPTTRLVNSYGLTEATMDSTYFEPPPGATLPPGRLVPIGRPLPNTRVYVLDSSLEPQPVGVPGELCIGGAGVACGYLNRPELNAARFAPDPFAQEAGGRLFRTGDRARWLADGTIEFLGRGDRQLKMRGFRIEPGEIESVLELHPRIRAAAVTERKDPSGAPCLAAYLAPADPSEPPSTDELRRFVAQRLPAYMIPAAWVLLNALPTTPNGKVALDALPDPVFDRSAESSAFVAPRTDTERKLVGIWRELLGIEAIGVDDNFFSLGGHSLLAVRVFARIEERCGVRLPLALLFQSATIAELANIVDQNDVPEHDQTWSSVVPMRPLGDRPPFFLVGWVGGQLIGYRKLVRHFTPGVPLYGLQAPGLDGRRLPIATIEGLAAHYVQEMRRVQPRGPYYLGGFCFAGVVAYEMARQLSEQGEDLGMVALIDSYTRGSRPRPSRQQHRRRRLAEFRDGSPRQRVVWVRDRVVRLKNRIGSAVYLKSGYVALDILAKTGLPIPRKPWNLVLVASIQAARRYTPTPCDIRIEYFRPQTAPNDDPTPWDGLAQGGVVLRRMIGPDMTHESITNGNGVAKLVDELTRALDEAMPEVPDLTP
jgi:amino acid adenylation domain-containing protein